MAEIKLSDGTLIKMAETVAELRSRVIPRKAAGCDTLNPSNDAAQPELALGAVRRPNARFGGSSSCGRSKRAQPPPSAIEGALQHRALGAGDDARRHGPSRTVLMPEILTHRVVIDGDRMRGRRSQFAGQRPAATRAALRAASRPARARP